MLRWHPLRCTASTHGNPRVRRQVLHKGQQVIPQHAPSGPYEGLRLDRR